MKENLPLNLSSSLRRNIDGINHHAKFEQMKHPSLPEEVGKYKHKTLLNKANYVALKGIFILFSFFLFSTNLFAQINVRDNIRQKVALAKTAGKVFEQVKLFDDNSKSGVQNFLAQVSKGVTFDINTQLTADFLKNKFEQVTLEIPGAEGSGPMLVELVRSKVLADDFNLFTSAAPKVPVAYDGGIHYQGVVAGSPETLVAISVFPEMVMGLIVTKQGNYNLGRIQGQQKKHILFLNADLNEDEQFVCGTVDDGINYTPAQLANNPSSFVSTCPVRVYVEVDNSVYTGWSSNLANTTNFVTGLFNQSFVLYANEDILMVMSELVIWTTADPYTGGTTGGQLALFQANTGAFNGDIGHLISNQNIGGLAAGFDGLCNPNTDLSLCFSGLSGLGFSNVPTFSFNVFIITHEMGHLVGSRHTHACVWNGNGTAIDGCAGYTELGSCPVPGNPAGGGTIMSYCSNTAVGVNFNLGFGTQPGNAIRNAVTNATCLTSCCVAPVITCPGNISVNNTPGQCGANVTYAAATATGTPAPTITYSKASGTFFPVGTTTVTATATNICGTVTCTFNVTVIDNQFPVITCPFNITVNNAPGTCGAVVNYNQPSATDNCGTGGIPTSIPGYTYKGTFGSHSYFVSNSTAVPEVAHAAAIALGGHLVTIASAAENAFVSAMRPETMWIGYTDRAVESTYKWITNEPVTYTNWAAGEPNDYPNPGIPHEEDWAVINWTGGGTWNDWFYNISTYYVVEFEGGTIPTTKISGPPSGSVFPVGTTTVTYQATDASGNASTCSFTVTVVDIQPPVITACAANITSASDAGSCTKTFTAAQIGLPTASDNCSYIFSTTRSDGAPNLTDPFPFGITTITWTATDPAGLTATCTQTININLITTNTTVTVTPNPQQYSDRVTFVATVTPNNCAGAGQIGGMVTFKIGTLVMGTAPVLADGTATLANVALLEPSLDPASPPNGPLKPGVKTVTAVYSGTDPDYIVTNPTTSLTITCEDARAYYTGACYASTASPTSSNAIVTLSATVKDISATPDAAGDISSGDIRNATVTFINIINNSPYTYTVIATVPVGLVNPGDLTVGTATYNWNVTINGDAQQFTIGIIVNNYYCRNNSDDNTVVTVAKPLGDLFITGGGYLVLTNSAGIKAGTVGTKNNFGFNVKYNKAKTNLQGNINTIVRKMEGGVMRVYQIKGNVMTSLVVNTSCPKTAIFNGKANIKDITDPLVPISVDGNATLQVKMTDMGEPGSEDSIAITLWDKNGGLWFASNWNGTTTIKQVLGGGNLKVHGGDPCDPNFTESKGIITEAALPEQVIISEAGDFKATANPNPSHAGFNIQVISKSDEPIVVRLMDVNGNVKEVSRVFTKTSTIKMGERLIGGTYFAEVTQGNKRKVLKLVKVN